MKPWKEQFTESTALRSAEVAHDLKTPLNVAVLNLELARMKARKIAESDDDDSISNYLKAVEGELRRIARIFDAYFVYVVPPEDEPIEVDLQKLFAAAFGDQDVRVEQRGLSSSVRIHPERANVLVGNLVEGAAAVLESPAVVSSAPEEGGFLLEISGSPRKADEEVSRIFKFYYTDVSGSPAFGLATARLIAESYGGTLGSRLEDGVLAIELRFPAGDE